MKKLFILIILIAGISYPVSLKADDGIFFSVSGGYKYFSAGIGYGAHVDDGDYNRAGAGFLIEYKTDKEMAARLYAQFSVVGLLIGFSPLFVTDFDDNSFGIAPEIGIGYPGFSLTYRYNFYLREQFNCFQIGIVLALSRL